MMDILKYLELVLEFLELLKVYLELFATFFMIGAVTFGGGYAMLPMIQEQVVAHDWATAEELINFVAISESTPGPFAINMATFIGADVAGIVGSACATLGVVLPSFIIILIVARCYDRFRKSSVVKGCMSGLKPAVVGLIANAVWKVIITIFFNGSFTFSAFAGLDLYLYAGVFAAMLILAFKKVHPILVIVFSAIAGILIGYFV